MGLLGCLLFAYLLGGLTFLPALAILAYYALTAPHAVHDPPSSDPPSPPTLDDNEMLKGDAGGLPAEIRLRERDSGAASGYFAVTREFVPGGVSGKPPDRPTPVGGTLAVESPSVYQSMYRSIFERNKQSSPSMDANRGSVRANRRARNVFFVVLRSVPACVHRSPSLNLSRLAHLMLYDDEDQLEVRYVIALEQYDIDIHSADQDNLEGELFVKRNCIRLRRRKTVDDLSSDSKPFFFYCDNCSHKEDFYHAMLHAQQPRPVPLQFEHDHLVKLVRLLHASEDTVQTRWLNALIGRLFLSLYRTSELPTFISTKIAKKISRVQKPAFIERIVLQKVDLGDSAPLVTNPKLRELNLDGDITVEADVKYYGNFRLEISAVAKIDLGQRFKPREVTLMLAGILRSLEGHVLFRIKPPPSNRIWFSFETMPKLDLVVEPVVSTRQITYGIILRAIESRIREVIGDTLVQPNWDDVPFLDTRTHLRRGGLWEIPRSDSLAGEESSDVALMDNEQQEQQPTEKSEIASVDDSIASPYVTLGAREKTQSMPILVDKSDVESDSGKTSRRLNSIHGEKSFSKSGILTTAEHSPSKPEVLRTKSFAPDHTPVPAEINNSPRLLHESTPANELFDSQTMGSTSDVRSRTPQSFTSLPAEVDYAASHDNQPETPESVDADGNDGSSGRLRSNQDKLYKRQSLATSAASATATAAKWGYDILQRRRGTGATARTRRYGSASKDMPESSHASSSVTIDEPSFLPDVSQPIGRGQPLPPPGQPLPGPRQARRGWTVGTFGGMTRRKPVPVRNANSQGTDSAAISPGVHPTSVSEGHPHQRTDSYGSTMSVDENDAGNVNEHVAEDNRLNSVNGDANSQEESPPPPLPPRDLAHEDQLSDRDLESDEAGMSRETHSDFPQGHAADEVKSNSGDEAHTEADFGDWEENVPVTPLDDDEEDEDHASESAALPFERRDAEPASTEDTV